MKNEYLISATAGQDGCTGYTSRGRSLQIHQGETATSTRATGSRRRRKEKGAR